MAEGYRGVADKMLLVGHSVEYLDDSHLYLVDGIIVPSVSQLLRTRYGGEYATVAPAVLSKAAEAGTKMHADIQNYEETGAESGSKELHNYLFLKKHYAWEMKECEKIILIEHKGKFYCGRFDMLVGINGGLGIIDFKRRSAVNKDELALQLNLYRIGYEQTYGEKIDTLAGIQLREDVRRYIKIPIKQELAEELIDDYEKSKTPLPECPF